MNVTNYLRGAIGAFFIFLGLTVQGIAWCLDQTGYLIECAGSGMAEW